MVDRREREKKQLEQIYKTKNLFFKPLVVRTEGGNINLGQNNIFHVNVYLMSEGGAITIGNYNIFEDKVIILNKSKTEEMIIGSFNHFKEGAKIYNTNIGQGNKFGINCHIDKCNLENGNIIGSNTKLKPSKQLWSKKTIAVNGLISENKFFDDNMNQKIMFATIKNTSQVYYQERQNREKRQSQIKHQRSK